MLSLQLANAWSETQSAEQMSHERPKRQGWNERVSACPGYTLNSEPNNHLVKRNAEA